MKKNTMITLQEMKRRGEKITALTAYDAATAQMLNQAGIDLILVGDSVGNVKLGYENTIAVTLEDMLRHTQAVQRGNARALLIADMPYLSYHISIEETKRNAGRLVKEGGAAGVKIEGGQNVAALVQALSEIQIPVMGHLGLTPQSIHKLGGYSMQGKTSEAAEQLLRDAQMLQEAGAFAIVLECIPPHLAQAITKAVSIPTIGIGAGPHCDGQILVVDDLLGLTPDPLPKFVKKYANLRELALKAMAQFKNEVKSKKYPK